MGHYELRTRLERPQTLKVLLHAVKEKLSDISQEDIDHLVRSMSKRLINV